MQRTIGKTTTILILLAATAWLLIGRIGSQAEGQRGADPAVDNSASGRYPAAELRLAKNVEPICVNFQPPPVPLLPGRIGPHDLITLPRGHVQPSASEAEPPEPPVSSTWAASVSAASPTDSLPVTILEGQTGTPTGAPRGQWEPAGSCATAQQVAAHQQQLWRLPPIEPPSKDWRPPKGESDQPSADSGSTDTVFPNDSEKAQPPAASSLPPTEDSSDPHNAAVDSSEPVEHDQHDQKDATAESASAAALEPESSWIMSHSGDQLQQPAKAHRRHAVSAESEQRHRLGRPLQLRSPTNWLHRSGSTRSCTFGRRVNVANRFHPPPGPVQTSALVRRSWQKKLLGARLEHPRVRWRPSLMK